MPDMTESFDPGKALAEFDGALKLERPVADVTRICTEAAGALGLTLRSKSDSLLAFREPWRVMPAVEIDVKITKDGRQTRVWAYGWSAVRTKINPRANKYVSSLVTAFLADVARRSQVFSSPQEGSRRGGGSRRTWERLLTLAQQASLPIALLAVIAAGSQAGFARVIIGVAGAGFMSVPFIGEFVRRRLLGLGSRDAILLLAIGLGFDLAAVAIVVRAVVR